MDPRRLTAVGDETTLTTLHTYEFLLQCLSQELWRSERHSTPVSLLQIDVDDAKLLDDKGMRNSGLASIEHLVLGSLRRLDVAARAGDGKYTVLLPSTPKVGARVVAERTSENVQAFSLDGQTLHSNGVPTVSIGVVTYPADALDAEELVLRAKGAAEIARATGKNQVHLYAYSTRSHRRILVALRGCWRALGSAPQRLTTIDVSEGGLLFAVDSVLPVGLLLEVELILPDTQEQVMFAARVQHFQEHNTGEYEVAVGFVASSNLDQNRLVRFLRETMTSAEDFSTQAS